MKGTASAKSSGVCSNWSNAFATNVCLKQWRHGPRSYFRTRSKSMPQSCRRCPILFRRLPLVLFTNRYSLCGTIDKYARMSSVSEISIGTYRCLSFLACRTNSTPKFKSISLVSIFNASFLRKPHPYSIRNKIQNRNNRKII